MVVADGSAPNVSMFQGDGSVEGRRARLQRKWDSREAFTGKVGGVSGEVSAYSNINHSSQMGGASPYPSARPSQRGSELTGKVTGGGWNPAPNPITHMGYGDDSSSNYEQQPSSSRRSAPASKQQQPLTASISTPSAATSSQVFTVRPRADRHVFEVDVSIVNPGRSRMVDLQINPKHRSVTWIAELVTGEEETTSVEIPRTFDLEKVKIQDEFEQGRCKVSIPAVGQGVF